MPFTRSDGEVVADPTAEEIAANRTLAVNATHHASWSWNEEAVTYVPPSNPPDTNYPGYIWDENTTAWVVDQRRSRGKIPFTPGSDDLYFGIKHMVSQLKADLIVPLAR